uniref:Uncharacterized protein n=1 Tax=Cuerna arida TaxID=1464854 RepID=A0A1B6GW38_9HEMI
MPPLQKQIDKTKKGTNTNKSGQPTRKNGTSGKLLKQSNQQRTDSNTKKERKLDKDKSNSNSDEEDNDQLPKFRSGLLEKEIKLLNTKRNLQRTGRDNSNVTKEDEKTPQPMAKEVNKNDERKLDSNSVMDQLVKCLTDFFKILCAYLNEIIQHIVNTCLCCNDL